MVHGQLVAFETDRHIEQEAGGDITIVGGRAVEDDGSRLPEGPAANDLAVDGDLQRVRVGGEWQLLPGDDLLWPSHRLPATKPLSRSSTAESLLQ